MHAVDVKKVCKTYSYGMPWKRVSVPALKDVSFKVEKGELFGLLGPNGAGKSTLLNIMVGLVSKSSGKLKVFGKDLDKDWYAIKKMTGQCFGFSSHLGQLTGRDNLLFYGQVHGLTKKEVNTFVDDMASKLHLDQIDMDVDMYSSGTTQKLSLMKALINDPKLLLVDELTVGLDVETAALIRNYLKKLKKQGKTIILTTHYMEEADMLCDRIALINKGNILNIGTPAKLKQATGRLEVITLKLDKVKNVEFLDFVEGVKDVKQKKKLVRVFVDSADKRMEPVLGALFYKNIMVTGVGVEKPSLEDVFMQLTGRSLEEVVK